MTTTEFTLAVRRLAAEYNMLPQGQRVLCCVSGGADSMALLHVLYSLQADMGFSLWAAHYNHLLRGEDSAEDAQLVAQYCRALEIPLTMCEGDVAAEAKKRGTGLEETGRQMRYAFFEDCAKSFSASRIVTAHHADDNLETLLLNLTRGAGLRGLSGIPPVRGQIVRPMLGVTREAVLDYVRANEIPYREDKSNADTRFARNRLRHEVLPILRDLNPQVSQLSAGTLRSLRDDQNYLEARSYELYRKAHKAEEGLVIATEVLSNVPKALSVRAIQRILEDIEAPMPSMVHLEQIVSIARGEAPSASVHLPGGVIVHRVYSDILFAYSSEQEQLPPLAEAAFVPEGETPLPDSPWKLSCRRTVCPSAEQEVRGEVYLAVASCGAGIVVRPRKEGDSLALAGRKTKSLKKLMIEEKILRRERERVPVLADEMGVIMVAGFGPDRSRLAQPGQDCLAISWHKEEKS